MKHLFLVLAALFTFSCGGGGSNNNSGSNDPPDPPDPTSDCDFFELESNDTPMTAQFVDVLPAAPVNPKVCGYFTPPGVDIDTFFFPLAPVPGATQVNLTITVSTDLDVVPVVELLQSDYDTFGVPTGNYQSLGTFFGSPGALFILGWPVPYALLTQNDLFIRVTGLPIAGSSLAELYKLEYFTQ